MKSHVKNMLKMFLFVKPKWVRESIREGKQLIFKCINVKNALNDEKFEQWIMNH